MNKKKNTHLLLWFNLSVLFAVQKTHFFFNIWALSWPYLQDIFFYKREYVGMQHACTYVIV